MKSNLNLTSIKTGEKLRYYRKLRGFTLKSLAEELDVTSQQLQKYEKGLNRISTERLIKISTLLDIPISYFFEQETPFQINNNDEQLFKLIYNFKKISSYKIKKLLVENSTAFAEIN